VLVAELMKRPEMTVAEMTAVVHRYGHQLTGRASKVISDDVTRVVDVHMPPAVPSPACDKPT
jgi:hypothetical protein